VKRCDDIQSDNCFATWSEQLYERVRVYPWLLLEDDDEAPGQETGDPRVTNRTEANRSR
jgi:hypothetical protein